MSNWKQIALEQLIVAETRLTTLRTEKNLLASELRQVKQQIIDTRSELQAVHKSFDLVKQEEEIMKPMVERGYEPKLKLIQLKQKIEDTLSRKERLYNELDLLDLQVNEVKERESSIVATFLEQLAVDVEAYSTKLNRSSNELKKIKRRINAAGNQKSSDRTHFKG